MKYTFYNRLKYSYLVPVRYSVLLVLVYLIQVVFEMDLGFLGVYPLSIGGLIGILCAPLIHGSYYHLVSNIFPILFIGTSMYFFYDRIADRVFVNCFFWTNLIVWAIGRPYYHIGSSGLVYGLALFMISLGFFRGTFKSLLISVVTIFLYGSIIYGVLPSDRMISWESHLAGAMVGVVTAFYYSKKGRLSSF